MREPREPAAEGCPLWVVTFGDAMSLLVTFFVMLVSFADFEEHNLQNMMGALKGGLRAVPLPMATTVGGVEAPDVADANKDIVSTNAMVKVAQSSQEVLRDQPSKKIIKTNSPDYYLHLLKNGVSLIITRNSVFESGTAELVEADRVVWQVAVDLMHSVEGEIRIAISLPENVVVRLRDYTTSWGLGIEQALAVQDLLFQNGGDRKKMSTSVRVVKSMPHGEAAEGTVEIRFIGVTELNLKNMPKKILKGTWREQETIEKEQHGEES